MSALARPSGVCSAGYVTELAIHGALGSLREVELGWRCALPRLPDYPWANILVFRDPPHPGDGDTWRRAFDRYFAGESVTHISLGWDRTWPDRRGLKALVARGFTPVDCVTLAWAPPVTDRAVTASPGAVVRRLVSERDFDQLLACQLAVDSAETRPFGPELIARRLAWHRELMSATGAGWFFGAEVSGRVVAGLGMIAVGGDARVQSVGTHPDFRGRRIGEALVRSAWAQTAARTTKDLAVERLLAIAWRAGPAERFYRRLGFTPVSNHLGAYRARERG